MPWPQRIGFLALSAAQLVGLSELLGTPIYWAGPQTGYRYQFSRGFGGQIFVRYLPSGVPIGATGRRFRIVASYPHPGVSAALASSGRIRPVAR